MHRGTWTALALALCLESLAFAQGGLDLANILQVLEDLKSQMQSLQQSFTDQASQVSGLNEQVGALTQQWGTAQQLIEKVPGLESQVAPLLAQWPQVQQMAQTFGTLQGQLSDQLQKLAQLQQAVAGLGASSADPRLDAVQAQMVSLQQDIQSTRSEKQAIQAQLDSMQMWMWGALGGVAILLVLQGITWFRRAPKPAR